MKTIIFCASICLAICLSSCEYFGQSSSSDSVLQSHGIEIGKLRDDLNSIRKEIDSINVISGNGVTSHLDSLNTSLCDIEVRLNKLEGQSTEVDNRISNIEKSNSKSYFWTLIYFCLISCILSIWSIVKVQKVFNIKKISKINSRLDRHRDEIEQLKKNYSNGLNPNLSSLHNSITRIDQELKNLKSSMDYNLRQMASEIGYLTGGGRRNNYGNERNQIESSRDENHNDNQKISGYFGDIIGHTYFRDLMVSQNEKAIFSVWVSGDTAHFQPISLVLCKI